MKRLALFSILAAAFSSASAADLQISPVGMTLAPQQKVESLRIINRGKTPTKLQMRAFAWSQSLGQTVETPTNQVRLAPAQFDIAPGATQVVRVIRTAPPSTTETTYRVLISELPSEEEVEENSGSQVKLKMDHNLPLFYRPPGTTPALTYSWSGTGLSVSNTGTATAQLATLSIDGTPVVGGLLGYVLPGSTMVFPIGKTAPRVELAINGERRTVSVP
jgi:fimbrial chaperone protein